MAKKWPEIVVQRSFMRDIGFETEFSRFMLLFSDYKDLDFTQKCEVEKHFKDNLHKASADGDFNLRIIRDPLSSYQFDAKEINEARILLSGSKIETRTWGRSRFMLQHVNQSLFT